MKYNYEAFNAQSTVSTGQIEAKSEQDAAQLLRDRGLYVQKIELEGPEPMKTVFHKPLPEGQFEKTEGGLKVVDKALKTEIDNLAATQIMPKPNWKSELENDLAMIEEVVSHFETLPFFKKGPGSKLKTEAKELAIREMVAKAIYRGVKNRALS